VGWREGLDRQDACGWCHRARVAGKQAGIRPGVYYAPVIRPYVINPARCNLPQGFDVPEFLDPVLISGPADHHARIAGAPEAQVLRGQDQSPIELPDCSENFGDSIQSSKGIDDTGRIH